jgi:hypothetical protein
MSERDEKGKFKPGYSGNIAGKPALSPELRMVRDLTPNYVKKIISKLALMDRASLMAWLEKPGEEAGPNNLEMVVASILVKATQDGDHSKLNFLLDRTIGKVVEQKIVTLQPVEYITAVRPDGALIQSVVNEALGEEDGEPGSGAGASDPS